MQPPVLAAPSPAQRLAEIRRLTDLQLREVGDPKLRSDFCDRVSAAIVDGEYAADQLERVLRSVEKARRLGKITVAVWSYYVGAVSTSMRENARSTR
jgi:hypothetical protein